MPGKGRAFQKGNPGRPKGAPNRITQVIRDIVNPAAPEILKDIVQRAKLGDPFAQRAYLTLHHEYRRRASNYARAERPGR